MRNMTKRDRIAGKPVAPELSCYAVEPDPPAIVPGRADRDRMDQTDQRYAYRCIPLSMANASGWEILSSVAFSATWFGDNRIEDIVIAPNDDPAKVARVVSSHFGHGIVTFHTGYVFRTSPSWALWCRGTPNAEKRRIAPLEGVVETDWLPFPFTMNWRFSRTGAVRFAAGEPFCFITPVPHALFDDIQPRLRKLGDDPKLEADYTAWTESRTTFNADLANRDPKPVAEGWQRHYVRGVGPQDEASGYHLSKRKLRKPIA